MKCLRTATIFNLKNFLRLKPASARLALALVLFLAAVANAQTNGLSDAEIKGRELAQQICNAWPEGNITNTGVARIRNGKINLELPLKTEVVITPTNWISRYTATCAGTPPDTIILEVTHFIGGSNCYRISDGGVGAKIGGILSIHIGIKMSGDRIFIPFAGSDFWLCDLGLEFFHWPAQKTLPKTTNLKRGREYTLLESTNPNPTTNGYSRVLSWIDKESGGILEADAYDAQGKLLKVFEPKSFKKVNGQWELQEMEIRNIQTDSRTRLEFDLKKD